MPAWESLGRRSFLIILCVCLLTTSPSATGCAPHPLCVQGIPGFDDEDIPRVVGLVGAALLVANHLAQGANPSDAQARSELIGAFLAACCVVTPTLGKADVRVDVSLTLRVESARLCLKLS